MLLSSLSKNIIIFLAAPNFAKMSQISCNLEEDGNKLRMDFQAYLSALLTKLQETTDQEEINIVNSILT